MKKSASNSKPRQRDKASSPNDFHHILADLEFTREFELRQQAMNQLEARLFQSNIDTRAALAPFSPFADEYQKRVIDAAEETIRIVAPAGSGKTQTLINRVLSAIRDGLKSQRVLILTFDNAAAGSLKSKLTEELKRSNVSLTDLPSISTLNSFGYSILREHFPEEFRPVIERFRHVRLFREVKEVLRERSPERLAVLPQNLANTLYLEFFSILKNELFDPRQPDVQKLADFILASESSAFFLSADRQAATSIIQSLIWLYMALERAMAREKVLDFDDQKLRSYLSLVAEPTVLSVVQARFREVIVDEFQDINRLDFVFIEALSKSARLVVCGDDDQAIYGFRGCSPDYIMNLDKHIERPVASFELSMNYRCPPNIVDHADRLIRNNSRRVEKSPVPHRTDPAEIQIVSSLSAGLEAKLVVSFIRKVKLTNPRVTGSDFAVLYRTNAQSLPLQIEFILNDLDYYVRDEDNILRNEVLDRLLSR